MTIYWHLNFGSVEAEHASFMLMDFKPTYRCQICETNNRECSFNGWGRGCDACEERFEGHCIFRFNYGWEDFMTRPEFADNKMRWGLDLFPVADMAKHVPILLECNQLRHSRTVDLLHTRVRFVNSFVELLLLGRQWEAAGYSKEALDILADQRAQPDRASDIGSGGYEFDSRGGSFPLFARLVQAQGTPVLIPIRY
ncbi:hypothetical protein DFH06DRAFT_1148276 [Mycena polygramma]|nr:hypothetical protein DFH06DRAFT_1148276 [Mycena polygramma]